MTDFRCYSHDFITEFIEIFRSNPCLWKISSVQYKNKTLKRRGYNVLLEHVRKVDKDATLDAVKRKINSLRAGYRKENKKVLDSMKAGVDSDLIYVPKLWYYNQLQFLNDQREGTQSIDSLDSMLEIQMDNDDDDDDDDDDELLTNEKCSSIDTLNEIDTEKNINVFPPGTSSSQCSTLRRKRQADDEIINTLSTVGKKFERAEDEYDAVGKNVAAKLRNMCDSQQAVAEKLINEVLFLGRIKKLTLSTTIHDAAAPALQRQVIESSSDTSQKEHK